MMEGTGIYLFLLCMASAACIYALLPSSPAHVVTGRLVHPGAGHRAFRVVVAVDQRAPFAVGVDRSGRFYFQVPDGGAVEMTILIDDRVVRSMLVIPCKGGPAVTSRSRGHIELGDLRLHGDTEPVHG